MASTRLKASDSLKRAQKRGRASRTDGHSVISYCRVYCRRASTALARRPHLIAQAPRPLGHGLQLRFARRAQTPSLNLIIEVLPDGSMGPPGVALSHGLAPILGYLRPIASTGPCPGMSPGKEPEHGVEKGPVGQRVRLPRLGRKIVTYELPLVVLKFQGRGPLGRWITLSPAFRKDDRVGIDAERKKCDAPCFC